MHYMILFPDTEDMFCLLTRGEEDIRENRLHLQCLDPGRREQFARKVCKAVADFLNCAYKAEDLLSFAPADADAGQDSYDTSMNMNATFNK